MNRFQGTAGRCRKCKTGLMVFKLESGHDGRRRITIVWKSCLNCGELIEKGSIKEIEEDHRTLLMSEEVKKSRQCSVNECTAGTWDNRKFGGLKICESHFQKVRVWKYANRPVDECPLIKIGNQLYLNTRYYKRGRS